MSNVKLYFDGVEVTINKGSYSLNPVNKQTLKETEGGTLRRYIQRLGVPNISVNMPANDTEYSAIYSAFVSGQSMTVKYYNPGSKALETFTGFIDDLTADCDNDGKDNSDTEWNISFNIKSM